MKIAIVGTGMVGSALARAWNADHQVTLITRDPAKPEVRALVDELDGVEAAEVSPAAASGADVVVLAVPAAAAVEVIAALGDLSGTVVIDPGNPLAPDFRGLTGGTTTSLAEKVAEATSVAWRLIRD